MNITIGRNIKKLRASKQITQKQLANFLGITEQAVSRWESESGYPDITMLPSIASFFGVSSDTLLGMNMDQREARLAEIRLEIKKLGESGEASEETLAQARLWAAEFPAEEDIQENLAAELTLCYTWTLDESEKRACCKESEKIYKNLIETTRDPEYRNHLLEGLAYLYASHFCDMEKAEETADLLPTMKYCRESIKSNLFTGCASMAGETKKLEYTQDYIEKLTSTLAHRLLWYVLSDIPNGADRWDEKIGYLEKIIDLHKFVFGENMLCYHNDVSRIYYYVSTYRIAQGRVGETLEALEKMIDHVARADEAKAGDRFTSPFMDQIVFPGPTEEFDFYEFHNCAYYLRERIDMARFDSIAEDERFRALMDELDSLCK
ncbi:MAG: helix-turn-helix transcriptional regulator [Clostridia bacterium]|nr:helix-turn-helix transcriptional regulator [Clostridia bacterium]